MEFRPATTDDLEAIRAIARDSWETDYPDIVSRETIDEGFEDWYASDELARELREGDATMLLAVEDDQPVGFAHGIVSEGVGNVLRLYVRPEARGRGVGSDLLERTAERLGDEGADHLRAMVLEDNETGRAFYRSAGFEAVDDAETKIGSETQTELTLERPLRTPAESA
ncbi:GNAT family N-acetyltransferase [Natronomonas salina]|uniref:GNAT family N-acetyltransferase n=1 Tax=Natronomonas salina TaxID=1710540 RepID=UPI0015B781B1|nr:GNAT family N-acetyltransferase [Natronomonas salina]QLD88578.1 GNAT family N-acetyltransferase [Natronomonas salina]